MRHKSLRTVIATYICTISSNQSSIKKDCIQAVIYVHSCGLNKQIVSPYCSR